MNKIIPGLIVIIAVLGLGYLVSKPANGPVSTDETPVATEQTETVPTNNPAPAPAVSSPTPTPAAQTPAPKKAETSATEPAPQTAPAPVVTQEAPKPTTKTVTVTYQNNAFSPASVTINLGDTVIFKNNHTSAIFVASNPHPIHTSFPALDSETLEAGAEYRFTATQKATISYHNHFNPSAGGSITVQ